MRPIYGYCGVIGPAFDFVNVRRLAEGEVNVVLAGPVVGLDPAVLPRRANVHFTGRLDEAEAAALAAGFDETIEANAR